MRSMVRAVIMRRSMSLLGASKHIRTVKRTIYRTRDILFFVYIGGLLIATTGCSPKNAAVVRITMKCGTRTRTSNITVTTAHSTSNCLSSMPSYLVVSVPFADTQHDRIIINSHQLIMYHSSIIKAQ